MKLLLAAVACLTSVAAVAQTAPAPADPHAGHAAASTDTSEAAARFNLDTPIETLVADPRARAVLDARMPGLTSHASYEMFKAMSLRALKPYSQGRLTDELMVQIGTELAAIR